MIDFRFKVCLFGDGGVGKTTLTQRYLTGVFKERYSLTIGMDFYINILKNPNFLQFTNFKFFNALSNIQVWANFLSPLIYLYILIP